MVYVHNSGDSIIHDNHELKHTELLGQLKAVKEQHFSPKYKHIGYKCL